MKFNQLTMAILSIFAVIIMIVPAIAVNEINQRTETNILSVEGLYNNGNVVLIDTPVYTDIENVFDCDYLGADSNNDTAFLNYASGMYDDNCYLGNYITYIGSGNYTIVPDYTDNPKIPQTIGLQFGIPLNITINDLLNADFTRININSDYTTYLYFRQGNDLNTHTWKSIITGDNESLFIPTLTVKSWLETANENTTVYLVIGKETINEFELEPVTISFKLESFELISAHASEFQDTTLYFLMIFALNIMFTIAFIFTTDTVDLFYDKNRKNKR